MATFAPGFVAKCGGALPITAAMTGGVAQSGPAVNVTGYTHASVFFNFGDVTGVGSTTLTITVEESANGTSGWTLITGATSGALDTSGNTYDNAVVCIVVNLVSSSRLGFIRVKATPVGAVNPGQAAGIVMLSEGGASVPTVTNTYARVVVV